MKKIIIGIVIILLVWFAYAAMKSPEEIGGDTMPKSEMGERTTTILDGSYVVDSTASEFVWIGRRNLMENYADSGTVVVSEGAISFVDGVLATGDFTINLETIDVESTGAGSGQSSLVKHLKSDAFFDVEQHPTSSFSVTGVEVGDEYVVTGDLTIKGITHEIQFPADIYMQDDMLHMDAEFAVDRTKWDIRYGSGSFFDDLGDKVIADEFEVTLMLVAEQAEEDK